MSTTTPLSQEPEVIGLRHLMKQDSRVFMAKTGRQFALPYGAVTHGDSPSLMTGRARLLYPKVRVPLVVGWAQGIHGQYTWYLLAPETFFNRRQFEYHDAVPSHRELINYLETKNLCPWQV